MYRHCGSVQAVRPIGGVEVQLFSFTTMALEGGEGSAPRPGRSLPPGKTRYPLYRRLGGPQGQSGQVRKISPPPGFNPRTVQPIASCYIDWATQPIKTVKISKKLGCQTATRRASNYTCCHHPNTLHCSQIAISTCKAADKNNAFQDKADTWQTLKYLYFFTLSTLLLWQNIYIYIYIYIYTHTHHVFPHYTTYPTPWY